MTLGSLGASLLLMPVAAFSSFETLIQVSARVQTTFDGCSMVAQPLNKEHTTAEAGCNVSIQLIKSRYDPQGFGVLLVAFI
jgi:hypothetical protein